MNRRQFLWTAGSIEKAVSSIESMAIPQAEQQKIFGGNALSILNNV